MTLTDLHGNSTHKHPGARVVTEDGRLLYIGTVDGRHEFFLDDKNLGDISLERALAKYTEAQNNG